MKGYQTFLEAYDDEDTHYQVHLDREALVPGSSHIHKINHYEILKPYLKKAGIRNVHPKDVTALGKEDITIFSPSKAHAHELARKINAHLPSATDHYREGYLNKGGHHVSVTGPYKGHPEEEAETAPNWESHEYF